MRTVQGMFEAEMDTIMHIQYIARGFFSILPRAPPHYNPRIGGRLSAVTLGVLANP